jgi:hypothetical protein
MDIIYYLVLLVLNLLILLIAKNRFIQILNILFILLNIYFVINNMPIIMWSNTQAIQIISTTHLAIYPFLMLLAIQVIKLCKGL